MVNNTEEAIVKEIRAWSKESLEKINPNFGDLPPCPYAENAWETDRVGISFKQTSSWQDLTTIVSTWDDKYLSLIHIPSPRDRTRSRMPSSA